MCDASHHHHHDEKWRIIGVQLVTFFARPKAARVDAVVDELKTAGLWDQYQLLDVTAEECPPPLLSLNQEQVTSTVTAIHPVAHLQRLRSEYASVSAKQLNYMQCTFGNEVGAELCAICGATRQREGEHSNSIIPEHKRVMFTSAKNLSRWLYVTARRLDRRGSAGDEWARSICILLGATTRTPCLVRVIWQLLPHQHDNNNKAASDYDCARILILDWDVHHGDGTQAVIENDPFLRTKCRFVSIHRHDVHFWPKSGTVEQGGDSVVNIPL